MSEFNGATLLITGGTGSFGNTVLKHFLVSDIEQIRIFSRDEKKQDDMRHHARGGLYFPCGGPEAGSQLRVFSHAGGKDQCGRYG